MYAPIINHETWILTVIAMVIAGGAGKCDWEQRRIPNTAIALLAILAAGQVLLAQAGILTGLGLRELFVNLALLTLLLPGYARGLVGAGDIKLVAVLALLWPPVLLWPAFAFGVTGLALAGVLYRPLLAAGPAEDQVRRVLPLGSALAMGAAATIVIQGLLS